MVTVSQPNLHLHEDFSLGGMKDSLLMSGSTTVKTQSPVAEWATVLWSFEHLEGSSQFNTLSAAASTAVSLNHADPRFAAG